MLSTQTDEYKNFLKLKQEYKHTDPIKSLTFKLILNALFGTTKSEFSKMYDSKLFNSIIINSQLACFVLAEIGYNNGLEIVQINTDGIFFKGSHEAVKMTKNKAQEITEIPITTDYFKKLYQLSSNQYCAEDENGNIKAKGVPFSGYNYLPYEKACDFRIISHMIINKLLFKKAFATTLRETDDLLLFAKTIKATDKFPIITVDGQRCQKVNRIFATLDGGEVFKYRHDGDSPYYYPDCPERASIYNAEITKDTRINLDYQFYINLATQKIKEIK